jgi:Protein of unknown function (DUF2530)
MTSGDLPGETPAQELQPVSVPMTRIVEIGTGLWAVALAVVLVIPSLHEGSRSWWPWCCAAGIVLGMVGYAYLRRGRGNAAEASGSTE